MKVTEDLRAMYIADLNRAFQAQIQEQIDSAAARLVAKGFKADTAKLLAEAIVRHVWNEQARRNFEGPCHLLDQDPPEG